MVKKDRRLAIMIPTLKRGGAERIVSDLSRHVPADTILILFEHKCEFEWQGDKLVLGIEMFSKAHWTRKLFQLISGWWTLSRLRLRGDIGPVVSFLPYADLLNLASSFGNPSIVTVHNTLSQSTRGRFVSAFKALLRLAYARADGVIAVSRGVRSDLKAFVGVDPNRVRVIHNPLDLDMIRRKADKRLPNSLEELFRRGQTILNVGRLVPQKGQDVLLQAFAQYLSGAPMPATLVIAGGGPSQDALIRSCESLQLAYVDLSCPSDIDESEILSADVVFLGSIENPYSLMRRATVFVSSSRWEGFGIVIAEALACGCPTIATDCPSGPREILSRSDALEDSALKEGFEEVDFGILTAPPARDTARDPAAAHGLSSAIRYLLGDEHACRSLTNSGLERAKDFDSAEIFAEWLDAFQEVRRFP